VNLASAERFAAIGHQGVLHLGDKVALAMTR
jgi:hypothetical protein